MQTDPFTLFDEIIFLLDMKNVQPADLAKHVAHIESLVPHIKREDWAKKLSNNTHSVDLKQIEDYVNTIEHTPLDKETVWPPLQDIQWAIETVVEDAPWLVGGRDRFALTPDKFEECFTIRQVIATANKRNLAFQYGVIYGDLAFVNQVEGGTEMAVMQRDSGRGVFESWSAGAFTFSSIAMLILDSGEAKTENAQ